MSSLVVPSTRLFVARCWLVAGFSGRRHLTSSSGVCTCSRIISSTSLLYKPERGFVYSTSLLKSKKFGKNNIVKSNEDDEESDSDIDSDDDVQIDTVKQVTVAVMSNRLDNVLKDGFGIQRKKVDEVFNAGKVRVNSVMPPKKSVMIMDGDTVDILTDEENSTNNRYQSALRIEIVNFGSVSIAGKIKMTFKKHGKMLVDDSDE